MRHASPIDGYRVRIEALDVDVARREHSDQKLTRVRGVLVLLLVLLLLAALTELVPRRIALIAAAVNFVGVLVVAGFHESVLMHLRVAQVRRQQQQQQRNRFLRRWSDLPNPAVEILPSVASLSRDLDLFGKGSLFQFVSRAHTPGGQKCLAQWIASPAEPDEIKARQEAVQVLSKDRELCDRLELHAGLLATSSARPDDWIAWAEAAPRYHSQPMRRWTIRLLAATVMLLTPLVLFGAVPPSWTLALYTILVVNVLVNSLFVGEVHDTFNLISAGKSELMHYAALFSIVEELPEKPERLNLYRKRMRQEGGEFRRALPRLQRIMKLGGGRRSSIFGIPWLFAEILLFWDFFVLEALERWQLCHGASVRSWYESVADVEALCSLATVARDHPDWCFPKIDPTADRLEGRSVGHPLLPTDGVARNDVKLGPPDTFLLVTGSNMSGKSTYLRSIGVNSVLALAGGPVCAEHFTLPVVRLATSMRVSDSLSDGVSFFMAELRRLKQIVDVSAARQEGDGPLLYLLDEILQGTNSAERHIAVARVIGHLLKSTAIGAISTHDLELASVPELDGRCRPVHFREQFTVENGERQMTFDYQLRDGVSPTTNALKLLELVGLDVTEND